MNDEEWDTFFELMGKIVDLELSVGEKINLVKEKSIECGGEAEMNLEEFLSWNFDY